MERTDIVVIGGGIAGIAVAFHLAVAHRRRVTLIERENLLASHASGRNAGIFLPVEHAAICMRLARRQADLLDALFDGEGSWLRRSGAILLGPRVRLGAMADAARATWPGCESLDRRALIARLPLLGEGDAREGLSVPDAGVIDGDAVIQKLRMRAPSVVRVGRGVARVVASRGRVTHVVLDDGSAIACGEVVLACGAWSEALGASCGARLSLVPLRRHLVWLGAAPPEARAWPVVWSLDDEVYFRPESGGVLTSPCDEDVSAPGVPTVDRGVFDVLARKLEPLAPSLASLPLRRAWACLRTYARDRLPVAGRDGRVAGLSWLAGLGGHGMTLGVAAAEVTARAIVGDADDEAAALSPARLFGSSDARSAGERVEAQ